MRADSRWKSVEGIILRFLLHYLLISVFLDRMQLLRDVRLRKIERAEELTSL